ncbi:hypothetical protein TrispH2_003963 [Trichoplax sp. H2]|nr:hypothetical protein TrispH2_003963 [Trichoplax sp. H2]|eukprot:RDD43372.1 hypothetical protein TrispH2_003963 [Trichoplax sp. H2]
MMKALLVVCLVFAIIFSVNADGEQVVNLDEPLNGGSLIGPNEVDPEWIRNEVNEKYEMARRLREEISGRMN